MSNPAIFEFSAKILTHLLNDAYNKVYSNSNSLLGEAPA